MQTATTSKQFRLGISDWVKGLIMAIGGAVYGLILGSIQSGSLTFDWKKIGLAALGAAVVYLGKNFFDQPKIVITGAPPAVMESVKEGNTDVKVGSTIAEIKPTP